MSVKPKRDDLLWWSHGDFLLFLLAALPYTIFLSIKGFGWKP